MAKRRAISLREGEDEYSSNEEERGRREDEPLVGLRRSARVDNRVPAQHQLLQLAPPLRLLVLALLANEGRERVQVGEAGDVVVRERDVLDVGEHGGEEEGREREERGEVVVGNREGYDL